MIAGIDRIWATGLRRRMRAHPAPTFVFADLAGYTALTEELGDEAAATIAREFERIMRELSRKHGARQVKSMGDGVMIWAPDAAHAVALAADAVGDGDAGSPRVRVGVHTGSAVLRGSDWYGSAVNVAARLADQARPGGSADQRRNALSGPRQADPSAAGSPRTRAARNRAARHRLGAPMSTNPNSNPEVDMTLPRRISKVRIAQSLLVASALVAAAFALGTAGRPAGAHLAAVRQRQAAVPLAARGPVSAALGRHESAYRVLSLRAHNRAQRLAVSFSRAGVSIASGPASVRLELVGYGRLDAPSPVARVAPRTAANRVDYPHHGIDEWYANGPLGLEQGFDVRARPAAASGPLTLALALSGNVRPRRAGSGLLLEGPAGGLRYGGLSASDAHGHHVRSWLGLRSGRLLIRVDDRHAAYPLRIDPLVQQARLTATDGAAMDGFSTVAVSPETIAVGAPGHSVAGNVAQGAVYVFQKPASGWAHATQSAELTVSGGAAKDILGGSVAISGDTIFAGAAHRAVDATGGQGAVYVFVKPPSGWTNATQTAELVASDGRESDGLGAAVAASGDTVVAASDEHTVGTNVQQGEGYVFVKPASGWANSNESAILRSSDGAAGDELGASVAISGDTIALGALNHAVGADLAEGAVYVYKKPAAGWGQTKGNTETTQLTATDGAAGDHFGSAVAISGDAVFAGAVGHHVGLGRQGAAYVFVKPAGGWNPNVAPAAELTASDGATDDLFGLSLAASGDSVLVGAFQHDVGPNVSQGAAYLFTKPGDMWTSMHQTEELTASDGAAGDRFGSRVGLAGNVGVAGSDATVLGNARQGAVYLFGVPPTIVITTPANGATYIQDSVTSGSFSCTAPPGAAITACTAPAADGAPIDTSGLGQHTFTAAASDSDGISATRTVTYSVIPSAPVRPPRLSITGVRQSASSWRLGSRLPQIARRRPSFGTTFSFVLNQRALAGLSFTRELPGRTVHGRCAAPAVRNKRRPRCTGTTAAGTLTLNGRAGLNRVRFQGRLARNTTLRPARYAMSITATTPAGQQASSQPLHFTITK